MCRDKTVILSLFTRSQSDQSLHMNNTPAPISSARASKGMCEHAPLSANRCTTRIHPFNRRLSPSLYLNSHKAHSLGELSSTKTGIRDFENGASEMLIQ